MSISSSLQPDTWGRLSQAALGGSMLSSENRERNSPAGSVPMSHASSSGLHTFPKLATSQNSSKTPWGERLMTRLVGSCAGGSSTAGGWMQPCGLFQGKCGIQGMRGPGLAPTCTPSPVVAHPGGHLVPTARGSTESREHPGWVWRNEDLVVQDEGWMEGGGNTDGLLCFNILNNKKSLS